MSDYLVILIASIFAGFMGAGAMWLFLRFGG